MKRGFLKYIIISLLLSITLYAKEYIYFLPADAKKAKNHIEKLIKNSKSSIDIAMYNLGYKKFIKQLKKAKKKGVEVNIVYDKGADLRKLDARKLKEKLHTKLAIFDKKTVVFGSANWTKASFSENYEIIYISDEENLVSKFNTFFKGL